MVHGTFYFPPTTPTGNFKVSVTKHSSTSKGIVLTPGFATSVFTGKRALAFACAGVTLITPTGAVT